MTELFLPAVKKKNKFDHFYQANHPLIFGHWGRLYKIHFSEHTEKSLVVRWTPPYTQYYALENTSLYVDYSPKPKNNTVNIHLLI